MFPEEEIGKENTGIVFLLPHPEIPAINLSCPRGGGGGGEGLIIQSHIFNVVSTYLLQFLFLEVSPSCKDDWVSLHMYVLYKYKLLRDICKFVNKLCKVYFIFIFTHKLWWLRWLCMLFRCLVIQCLKLHLKHIETLCAIIFFFVINVCPYYNRSIYSLIRSVFTFSIQYPIIGYSVYFVFILVSSLV